MKELAKRTAVAALAGVLTAGMLTGCGETKLDGTKTVATVDGVEIPLGVVSLLARQQQAYTEAMYAAYLGTTGNIWDTEADSDTGETYGEQTVSNCLEQVELMYIMKSKAADYGVELTEEDQEAIAAAAAEFMEANSEETLEELAVTEEHVKTFLELETYQTRIYDPIIADVDTEVSDEEAQKSSFSYVRVSISSDDLTDDEIAEKKEQMQEILDKMQEDPTADMDEVAGEVDESYSSYTGTFTTYESEDEEDSYSAYPDEVIEILRGLKEGEVCEDIIETDSYYYIVRLDEEYDEDATESEKESIISDREDTLYTETTEQWLEDADIVVNQKVLKTLKITDSHSFTYASDDTDEESEDEEVLTEEEIDEDALEDMETEELETEEDAAVEDTAEDAVEEDTAEDTVEDAAETTEEEVISAEEAEPTVTTAPN